MENSGYSLSDIASIVGKNDGILGGNGTGFIILILFLLMMGGGGFGYGNGAFANQVTNDFLYTNLSNQMGRSSDRIESVLNTGFTAVAQQGFAIDKDILSQTNQLNQTLCQGFNGVNANITDIGYRMQNCCCELKNAIHAEGEETRKLIAEQEVTRLRTDLQSAQLTLANVNQTQNILNSLGTYQPYASNGCNCNY
ncbi:MAG: hypothetical protein MJ211_10145 [Bacteroidales bacterium]|nr:hypothetical protein [Bacteroidales bacterium]